MKLTAEQERIKTLLAETITLLCKNGLSFKREFSIEALIGITLDEDDVLLLSIKETIKNSCEVVVSRESPNEFGVYKNCNRESVSLEANNKDDHPVCKGDINYAQDETSDGEEVDMEYTHERLQPYNSVVDCGYVKSSINQHVGVKSQSCEQRFSAQSNHSLANCTLSKFYKSSDRLTVNGESSGDARELGEVSDTCVASRNRTERIVAESDLAKVELESYPSEIALDTKPMLSTIDSLVQDIELDVSQIKEEQSFDEYDEYSVQFEQSTHNYADSIFNTDQVQLAETSSHSRSILDNMKDEMESVEGIGDSIVDPVNNPQPCSTFVSSNIQLTVESNIPKQSWSVGMDGRKGRRFSYASASSVSHLTGNSNVTLRCRYCSEVLPTMPAYLRHISTHRSSQDFYKYPCPCCEKSFSSHTNFRGHMSKHTGIKEFVCPYCGRGYAFKQMLKDHVNQHLGIVK